MRASSQRWFAARTHVHTQWSAEAIAAAVAEGGHRVSVVIPARNEAETVGDVVSGIRRELVEAVPVVAELVVIDSDSTDATAQIAREAGATVHAAASIRRDLGTRRGKGEALWKSLFVTTGDLLVFVDADLRLWGPHFVTGLLGPLLGDPQVQLVKGFYDRVVRRGGEQVSTDGGRVTELVARPVLDLWWPDLAAVIQPLAGEWAARRSLMESLSVPTGYGVEIGSLIDTYRAHGLDGIAQVDLGARAHEHQRDHDLAVMAAELMAVAASRTGGPPPSAESLEQYSRESGWRSRPVPLVQRPPKGSTAPEPDGGAR